MALVGYLFFSRSTTHVPGVAEDRTPDDAAGRLFVSYSYFEKDAIQRANFEFFLLAAAGVQSVKGLDDKSDYFIVLNGDLCSPCKAMDPLLGPQRAAPIPGVSWVRKGPGITLLKRTENEGMDFAAHNTSMSFAMSGLTSFWLTYSYYIFLNSSVKGPLLPKYFVGHWSDPYTMLIRGKVKAVGSSLACLPAADAGGPGPRLESWAFAIDAKGLQALLSAGVFNTRVCKLCTDGVVVMGEYGITLALFSKGFSVDTLMSKYQGVDWQDPENWNCNDQVHPSRHGTYDGISMHPFEVVFLKASWHVGEPFADKYAAWQTKHLLGQSTTAGRFDEGMYLYAISPKAQDKHPLIERAYMVGPRVAGGGVGGGNMIGTH